MTKKLKITGKILGISLLLMIAACSKVDQAHFDQVKKGMTPSEVRAILGEPTETDSVDMGFVSGTRSIWRDGGSVITLTFVQDKVQTRAFDKEVPEKP